MAVTEFPHRAPYRVDPLRRHRQPPLEWLLVVEMENPGGGTDFSADFNALHPVAAPLS